MSGSEDGLDRTLEKNSEAICSQSQQQRTNSSVRNVTRLSTIVEILKILIQNFY